MDPEPQSYDDLPEQIKRPIGSLVAGTDYQFEKQKDYFLVVLPFEDDNPQVPAVEFQYNLVGAHTLRLDIYAPHSRFGLLTEETRQELVWFLLRLFLSIHAREYGKMTRPEILKSTVIVSKSTSKDADIEHVLEDMGFEEVEKKLDPQSDEEYWYRIPLDTLRDKLLSNSVRFDKLKWHHSARAARAVPADFRSVMGRKPAPGELKNGRLRGEAQQRQLRTKGGGGGGGGVGGKRRRKTRKRRRN